MSGENRKLEPSVLLLLSEKMLIGASTSEKPVAALLAVAQHIHIEMYIITIVHIQY
jgi:hypothetical protein